MKFMINLVVGIAVLFGSAVSADDAYATSLERWLDLGGADLDERAEEVADSLGLGVDLDNLLANQGRSDDRRADWNPDLVSRRAG